MRKIKILNVYTNGVHQERMSGLFVFVVICVALIVGLAVFLSHYRSTRTISVSDRSSLSPPALGVEKATASTLTVARSFGVLVQSPNINLPFVLPIAQSNATRTYSTSNPAIFAQDNPPPYLNTGMFYTPVPSTADLRLFVRVRAEIGFLAGSNISVPPLSLGVGIIDNGVFIAKSLVLTVPTISTTSPSLVYRTETEITFTAASINSLPNRTVRIVPGFRLGAIAYNMEVKILELTLTEL